MVLKYKKLHPDAKTPVRASEGAAAYDLCALCSEEGLTLHPGERAAVPTGIAIELPGPEVAAFIFARSGLGARHGITLPNCVGVIDSDYRGELFVALVNTSQEPYTIRCGERIAQMAILPVLTPEWQEVETLSGTARGEKGFGSTGKL